MAIFHLRMSIIGGNSGRTAVGAAAYHRGEKLRNEYDGIIHDYTYRRNPISMAAYRSGVMLHDGGTTYDFTHKIGIVRSEIMLPEHAPLKYLDSGTLWNSAQKAEKQHNSRTAREIVIALPNELTLEQQTELVRDYVQRNFVDKGMCADFSIHSGHIHSRKNEKYPFQDLTIQKNNPHVHIMLTVRPINEDGTWGAKSKKEYILDKNGERIKLKSGNWKSRKIDTTDWDKTETLVKWREDWAVTVNKKFERLGIDERIDHRSLKAQGIDREPTVHMGYEAWNLERKGIKTKTGDKNRAIMARNKALSPENKAKYMHELKEGYVILYKEITELEQQIDSAKHEMNRLRASEEDITERVKNLNDSEKRLDELKAEQNRMGRLGNKSVIDRQIHHLERLHQNTTRHLKKSYDISPDQATEELKRLECKMKDIERIQEQLQNKLTPLVEEQKTFMLEYQRLKLLADISPEKEKIQDELCKLDKEIRAQKQSPHDEIMRVRSQRLLDMVTESNFQKILRKVQPEQAEILIEHLGREKVYEIEREHIRSFEHGR